MHSRKGFTLIELLVVIAIIAILAVVVVLTLNPAELLRQSRDANRVSDIATLTSALNLYTTDQSVAPTFSLGNASNTYVSIYDPAATSTNACPSLGLPTLNASSAQAYQCSASSTYRTIASAGWIPVNLSNLTSGSPIGNLPVDPINQTSTGLFYAYNTNGTQFEVTANLESSKYKGQYANTPQTNLFPEVISGGNPNISAFYNPSGLIGYWPLNEGSGSSTTDVSGNGNGGTWSGTPGSNGTYYTGGKVGAYAGNFNGSNDVIALSTSSFPTGSNSASFFAWIYLPTGTNNGIIFNYGTQLATEQFLLFVNNQSLGFWNGNGVTGSQTVSLNTWHFVGVVYSGGTSITLYLDGVSQTSTIPQENVVIPAQNPADIGAYGGHATLVQFWSGLIDEARFYNRALSAAEVMALYTAEK